ncbi:MAG TPA: NfeD family protein [Solirubrobacteraceae bacterium]|nr:NfeD family protein [Solirubrobacteraceae bacterium]
MAVTGVVLLVIGLLVAISEAHRPTHGIAGGLGVAVMAVGIAFALTGAGAGVAIGLAAAAALAAGGAGGVALAINRTGAVRRRRVRGGAEGLIGQIGVVRSWSPENDDGSVALAGAVWHARRSPAPEDPLAALDIDDGAPDGNGSDGPALHAGDRVVVEQLSGLTVAVRPAEDWELL